MKDHSHPGMARFGAERRKTDVDLDAKLAEYERKERIGRVALIIVAILAFGLVLGVWHWQAGVIFVGLSAAVCAAPGKDEQK